MEFILMRSSSAFVSLNKGYIIAILCCLMHILFHIEVQLNDYEQNHDDNYVSDI
jgi:hypothetical protein